MIVAWCLSVLSVPLLDDVADVDSEHFHFAEEVFEAGVEEFLPSQKLYSLPGVVGQEVAHSASGNDQVVLLEVVESFQDGVGVHGQADSHFPD